MLIYKITLTISGDDFFPSKLHKLNEGKLKFFDFFNPDQIFERSSELLGFGSISYMHENTFVKQREGQEYEEDFVKFLEINHGTLQDYGAKEFNYFTEVYYSGPQCNFEIFDRELLSRLQKLDLKFAFPVSIYKMKKNQLKELFENT